MKIAVVAAQFPTARVKGNVFVAKRMAELSRTDDPYGVRVERLDLMGGRVRRLAVAALGKSVGQEAATLLFRLMRPRFLRARFLYVDGRRSAIRVLVFRHRESPRRPPAGKRSIARIARVLRQRGCELVHSHFLWYADIGARIAAELGVPHVVTAHGSDVHETMRLDRERRELLLRVLQQADAAIFVSRALLEEAKSYGYSGRNARVVHNGFDPAIFHPPAAGAEERDAKTILFVGNLLEVKGADRLPRIFSLVAASIPGVRMKIIGADPRTGLAKAIRREIERSPDSGAVTFLGPLPPLGVADQMRRSDLVVVPSRREGFGCVAVEAQACGTPVLGTATGGLPEAIGDPDMVVDQDGDSEAALAEKAASVLRSRARRVRPDIGSLTWNAVVEQERAIYREVVARRQGRE